MKPKLLSIIFLFLVFTGQLFSQEIKNIVTFQEDNKIIITYDLYAVNYDDEFFILLSYSSDGGKSFKVLKENLKGDIGNGITEGITKRIEWDVLNYKDPFYGENIVFKVDAPLIDLRDGKNYKGVIIGDQVWMAENLNFETNSGSWCYDNSTANCDKYGRLYNWETAQTVCPPGWKLPSRSDFETLLSNVGGSGRNAYNALIPSGSSGFSLLFGGWRYYDGDFDGIGYSGYWWSSSESDAYDAWYLRMYSGSQRAGIGSYGREWGFSVRCLQDY